MTHNREVRSLAWKVHLTKVLQYHTIKYEQEIKINKMENGEVLIIMCLDFTRLLAWAWVD